MNPYRTNAMEAKVVNEEYERALHQARAMAVTDSKKFWLVAFEKRVHFELDRLPVFETNDLPQRQHQINEIINDAAKIATWMQERHDKTADAALEKQIALQNDLESRLAETKSRPRPWNAV